MKFRVFVLCMASCVSLYAQTPDSFLRLRDVPHSYIGQSGKSVRVDPTEKKLEFFTPGSGSVAWGDITGTLSNQTDLQTALNALVTKVTTLTIAGDAKDLSTNRTWTFPHAFGFTTDSVNGSITNGVAGYFTVHESGTISGWSITAVGSSPTCTIDVWKIATGTALPTVTNTIMGTKPALSTGNAKRSTTLTGWDTTIAAGDIFGFNIDAITNATKLTFQLEYTK